MNYTQKYPHYVKLPFSHSEYRILNQGKVLNRHEFSKTVRSLEPFSIQLTNGKVLNSKCDNKQKTAVQQQPLDM